MRFRRKNRREAEPREVERTMEAVAADDNAETRSALFKALLNTTLVAAIPNAPTEERSWIAGEGEHIGLVTLDTDEGQVIPVFTSVARLLEWQPEGSGYVAESLDVKDRSDFLVALLDQAGISSAWIDAIAAHPIEEERVIDHLASKVHKASRAEERRDFVSLIVAIRPSVPGAQRKVAELILWLLGRDTDVDFNVAVAALPALGTDHRSGGRLEKAFRDAVDRGRKLPERAQEDMRRAKIKLPKKAFKGRKFGPLNF